MDYQKNAYKKALKYYAEGNFEKSLKYCEKANLKSQNKNQLALNLIGIIHYIKGNISEAENAWYINVKMNNDIIAKGYLKDLDVDKRRMIAYKECLDNIKNMEITSAIKKLTFCSESDFNTINVNNGLAFCHMKKGDFEKAKEYSNKILSIDSKNEIAKNNLKEISYLEGNDKKCVVKISAIAIASLILIGGIATSIYYFNNKKAQIQIVIKNKNNKEKISSKQVAEKSKNNFNSKEFENCIISKDFNKLIEIIDNTNKNNITLNEKMLLEKGEDLLKGDGLDFYYNNGRKLISQKKYGEAINELKKALNYSEGSYLKPYIIYTLGNAEEGNNNTQEEVKYYSDYLDKYPNGEYEEEVLYKLAVTLKDVDINKSKKYGEKIKEKYTDTMYYNSTIKSILNSN